MQYKLSPSELTYLYDGCSFCFWLKIKHGIPQPSMPMPGIFSAIAGSQKTFYENKRTEAFCSELPAGVVAFGEQWVQSKPITFSGMADTCFIKGRFDCVVKFDDNSYGIIDFKTASPSAQKAEMYGRQLQAYTFALENPEHGALKLFPITKLGLLFFTPSEFTQVAQEKQGFIGNTQWIEVPRNDEGFMAFLTRVMQVLAADAPPQPAADCAWCKYREKMGKMRFEQGVPAQGRENNDEFSFTQGFAAPHPAAQKKLNNIQEPECPKCGGPMAKRTGKFGEFWSCQKYPGCKGTRNI